MEVKSVKPVARLAAGMLRKLRRRLSLQMTALIFILFVCVILTGLQTAYTWNARNRALADGAMDTANLARSIAQHAEDTIRTADAVLVGLVERLETDGQSPKQLDRLHRFFVQQVAALPQLEGLSVLDEKGDLIADSLPELKKLDLGDRDYFFFHKSHNDREPHVGAPVYRKALERWVIPVSRRIDHKDGSFAGVVVAAIDMAYFQSFYDTFHLG